MNQSLRLDKMKSLDHPPIEIDDIEIRRCRIGKRRYDRFRFGNFSVVQTETTIGSVYLIGMNQHLAVKTHGASLGAFVIESFHVLEIVKDTIDCVKPIGA